jgi:AraC-like DNA-binding protein
MLQQKAKHIKFDMLAPEVTLGDIILKYDFNSPTHFTRFCKQQFGCTPSEMMARQKKQKSMCPGA